MHARHSLRMTTVGIAVLGALTPAFAAEPAPAAAPELDPARPVSEVRAGVGYASNDGRYGQYNGINQDGFYGLFDFSVVRRKDETGTWLRFEGRNLGLDSRQIRFENNRQGNWGYFIE